MKNILFPFLLGLLVACNNNNKSSTETVTKDTTQTVVEQKDKPADGLPTITELEAMTPLKDDEIKSKLPQEVNGFKLSTVTTSNQWGTLSVSGVYTKVDSTTVTVELLDTGGPAGAGVFKTQYLEPNTETGPDSETTFDSLQFKGRKAFESCIKYRPVDCMFIYFEGTRFLVFIEGRKTGTEVLRAFASEFNLK